MALVTTFPLDTKTYGFELLRYMLDVQSLQEGVFGSGDLKVTAAAAGLLRVDIAAGTAIIQADTGTRNGKYIQVNDASVANAVTHDAADATNPRLDQVYLLVNDSSDLGSASDTPTFGIAKGVPTSGATLDNRNGNTALPSNAIRLADVLIPAGSTVVLAANIRDRRPWARGAYFSTAVWTTNKAVTGTTNTLIDPVFQTRLEIGSNNIVRVMLHMGGSNSVANSGIATNGFINGANPNSANCNGGYTSPTVNAIGEAGFTQVFSGSAGSYLFAAMMFAVTSGTATGYLSGGGYPGLPTFIVEELLRPNVNNGST